MTRRGGLALAAAVLAAAIFAYQNRFERVAMEIGPLTLYAIPLPLLVFAAILLGMAAMLLLSLPADRRTRELLRAHGLLDTPSAPPASTQSSPPPAEPVSPRSDDLPDAFIVTRPHRATMDSDRLDGDVESESNRLDSDTSNRSM